MSQDEFREWERKTDARIRPWIQACAALGGFTMIFLLAVLHKFHVPLPPFFDWALALPWLILVVHLFGRQP
jgi:hypothetical protein